MTIPSAAVYLQRKTGQEIQLSSEHEQTLRRLCSMHSMAVLMKNTESRCGPKTDRITSEYADYDEVIEKFDCVDGLAGMTFM